MGRIRALEKLQIPMTQVTFLTSTWSSSEVGALVKTHGAWGAEGQEALPK